MDLRSFALVLCVATFTAAATTGRYELSNKYTATTFNYRQMFLVMHYTVANFTKSVDLLTNYLSAHYLVPKGFHNGKRVVYQLVPEDKRAWTQGVSKWGSRQNLNDQGISIEIVNQGFTDLPNGNRIWYPFDAAQIKSVIELSKDIINRYKIKPTNVIGHSDCAPLRKEDPGPLFPWKKLFDAGIGAWPDQMDVDYFKKQMPSSMEINVKEYQLALKKYGYDIQPTGAYDLATKAVVKRFQMHFRNSKFDGIMDVETFAILKALLRKYFGEYKKVIIDFN